MGNEFTIDIRAGTGKLKDDIKDANNVISQLYNSGQASSGAGRPSSAAAGGGFPGSIKEYEDQLAKQESKAKASKYSSEAVTGGIGGGGINASGTKAFQINKAVINVAAGKINVVGSKSGLDQSGDVGGAIGGGSLGGGGALSGGGAAAGVSYRSVFSSRPGESAGDAFGRSYGTGSQVGSMLGNPFMSFHDLHNIAATGISGAYNLYKDYQSRRSAAQPSSTASHISTAQQDHHSAHIASTISRHRDESAQTQSQTSGAFSSIPIIGSLIGTAVSLGIGLQQKYADARIAYTTSQLATAGTVGFKAAGGTNEIGQLGYSAAAKGQMMMQTQQHLTSADFANRGGRQGMESAYAYSAKFGHAMGIGAGQGMAMSAQLGEIGQYNGTGVGGEAALRKIAGYARGFEGGSSRRLGRIAQFVTGLADQQQTEGGGGDSSAIAASLSRLRGHHLGESQHAVQGLSSLMGGGVHSGSPITGMLMLAEAQRGGSLDSMLKAGDKGITGKGIGDLQSMIPPDLMKYVLLGTGAKMTQAEHMTKAIHGNASFKDVDQATMGGTYDQADQNESNYFAFEQELLGVTTAAKMAAAQLQALHGASKAVADFAVGLSPHAGAFK